MRPGRDFSLPASHSSRRCGSAVTFINLISRTSRATNSLCITLQSEVYVLQCCDEEGRKKMLK
jgi:hypothetical protein